MAGPKVVKQDEIEHKTEVDEEKKEHLQTFGLPHYFISYELSLIMLIIRFITSVLFLDDLRVTSGHVISLSGYVSLTILTIPVRHRD